MLWPVCYKCESQNDRRSRRSRSGAPYAAFRRFRCGQSAMRLVREGDLDKLSLLYDRYAKPLYAFSTG